MNGFVSVSPSALCRFIAVRVKNSLWIISDSQGTLHMSLNIFRITEGFFYFYFGRAR